MSKIYKENTMGLDVENYTDKALVSEYHRLRDKIEGRVDGGFGVYELFLLGEVEVELDRRNNR